MDYPLPFDRRRKADIAFPRQRVAVFIDGCFWHWCAEHYRRSTVNREFWAAKIAENRLRDEDTDERLAELGWVAVRVWEHDDPQVVADVIEAQLAAR